MEVLQIHDKTLVVDRMTNLWLGELQGAFGTWATLSRRYMGVASSGGMQAAGGDLGERPGGDLAGAGEELVIDVGRRLLGEAVLRCEAAGIRCESQRTGARVTSAYPVHSAGSCTSRRACLTRSASRRAVIRTIRSPLEARPINLAHAGVVAHEDMARCGSLVGMDPARLGDGPEVRDGDHAQVGAKGQALGDGHCQPHSREGSGAAAEGDGVQVLQA